MNFKQWFYFIEAIDQDTEFSLNHQRKAAQKIEKSQTLTA